ncbi:MAG TPA: hypothetical protein VGN55_07320 [Xanthobacteraceae bacterium]
MSQGFKGQLALISFGLLAATSSSDGAAAIPQDVSTISPAARWLQLDPPLRLAQRLDTLKLDTAPKLEKFDKNEKLNTLKLGPGTDKLDVPTKGSTKSELTPPDPNKKTIDQTTNVHLVVVQDPKFGDLNVTASAKAAYLSLPANIQAKLGNPQGGKAVSAAALVKLASSINLAKKQFKPPASGPAQACADDGGTYFGGSVGCVHLAW